MSLIQRRHGRKAKTPIGIASINDVGALIDLRAEQGWLTSDTLLRALLAWENARTFIIRGSMKDPMAPGPLLGSTCATAAGSVGVIGNVVVRAEYRRRGLGSLLMDSAIMWLQTRGVRTVLLDASQEARALYFHCGFVTSGERSFYAQAHTNSINRDVLKSLSSGVHVALVSPKELYRIRELDEAAFGGDRVGLLAHMLSASNTWLYVACDEREEALGYALVYILDEQRDLLRVGPLVATSKECAASLLNAILDDSAPWTRVLGKDGASAILNVSIPSTSPESLGLFQDIGAKLEIDDLIMRLELVDVGTSIAMSKSPFELEPVAQHPSWAYAWLSNMVF